MAKKSGFTLSDVWTYYKGYVIGAVIVAVAVGYTLFDSSTSVKSDFLVECVSDEGFNYEVAQLLSESLSVSGAVPDINGDGTVVADVRTYQTGMSGNQNIDPQAAQIAQLRMAVGEGPIVIADRNVYNAYDDYGMFMDVSEFVARCDIDEQDIVRSSDGTAIAINIKNSSWLKASNINTDKLYVSLRVMNGDFKNDKETVKRFDAAKDVYDYIIK